MITRTFLLICISLGFSPAQQVAVVQTTFDTGTEGWTCTNFLPQHRASGGNPGGYIFIDNPETTVSQIVAPARYWGDRSAFNGGILKWDGNMLSRNPNHPEWTGSPNYGTVTISGGGTSVSVDAVPGLPTQNSWRTYSIPLTAAAFKTSEDNWRRVLSNVTEIRISIEAIFGDETHGIDNIVFEAPPAAFRVSPPKATAEIFLDEPLPTLMFAVDGSVSGSVFRAREVGDRLILDLPPQQGTVPGVVFATPRRLPIGSYTTRIAFSDSAGNTQNVEVRISFYDAKRPTWEDTFLGDPLFPSGDPNFLCDPEELRIRSESARGGPGPELQKLWTAPRNQQRQAGEEQQDPCPQKYEIRPRIPPTVGIDWGTFWLSRSQTPSRETEFPYVASTVGRFSASMPFRNYVASSLSSVNMPSNTVYLHNGHKESVRWEVTTGVTWLRAEVDAESLDPNEIFPVRMFIRPGMPVGQHSGSFEVRCTTTGERHTFAVNLVVVNDKPALRFSDYGMLLFGGSGTQRLTITNDGATTSNFTLQQLSPGGGQPKFQITPDRMQLAPGQSGQVQVQPASGAASGENGIIQATPTSGDYQDTPFRIHLQYRIPGIGLPQVNKQNGRSAEACVPSRLYPVYAHPAPAFRAIAGRPVGVVVRIIDDCGAPLRAGQITVSPSNGDPSLRLVSTGPGEFSGSYLPVRPADGVTLRATAFSANGALYGLTSLMGQVDATVAAPPLIEPAGITSSASQRSRVPTAPREIITIYGQNLAASQASATGFPLPRTLGGASVLLNGQNIPLVFASPGQINAVVPEELNPNQIANLSVVRGNVRSEAVPIVIAEAQPAVYTQNQTGAGAGIVTDAGYRLIGAGNATRSGQVALVFLTGLGRVTPPAGSGVAAPSTVLSTPTLPVTVSIGGRPAQVLFAGPTPGFSGLDQINVVVPEGLAPGDNVPLVVSVGGIAGPPVTITVR